MAVTQYDGWNVELNTLWYTTDVRNHDPSDAQIYNMNKVFDYFIAQGWTTNAIAGMLGNMMVESTVNPWTFQNHTLDWSNPVAILADNGGMGLTQWTPCRKYYQWALDSNLDPQSGTTMCDRIKYEEDNNLQWSLDNLLHYTWADYVASTQTPEILSRVFVWAYERPASPDLDQRAANARWVFENIHGLGLSPALLMMLNKNNKRKVLKRRCLRM